MKTMTGFVTHKSNDTISFRVSGDDVSPETEWSGGASFVRELGSEFMDAVVEGTYLDIVVGDDDYVVSISIKDVPKWTQEEIDAADKRSKELATFFGLEIKDC